MSFGLKLREIREAEGLSRKELAERAGMKSEAGIRDLEQGLNQPTWKTVQALADALGRSCEDFKDSADQAGNEEEMKRPPGRPAKPKAEQPAAEQPKRPRGRPKKERE